MEPKVINGRERSFCVGQIIPIMFQRRFDWQVNRREIESCRCRSAPISPTLYRLWVGKKEHGIQDQSCKAPILQCLYFKSQVKVECLLTALFSLLLQLDKSLNWIIITLTSSLSTRLSIKTHLITWKANSLRAGCEQRVWNCGTRFVRRVMAI